VILLVWHKAQTAAGFGNTPAVQQAAAAEIN
jgi:hypothetical protein